MELTENITRQIDEVECLRAIYSDELKVENEIALQQAEAAVADASIESDFLEGIRLIFSLPATAASGGEAVIILRVAIPITYPEDALELFVSMESAECVNIGRAVQAAWLKHLQQVEAAVEYRGSERILPVVQAAQSWFDDHSDQLFHTHASHDTAAAADLHQPVQRLGQRWLWFHHIKSSTKRRTIIAWARELGLSGLSKPGYPGVVFVEGDNDAVDEYVRRLRGLTWQAMQLRAEQVVEGDPGQTLDDLRMYNKGFRELLEHELGVMVAEMEELGLAPLFRRAVMKLA